MSQPFPTKVFLSTENVVKSFFTICVVNVSWENVIEGDAVRTTNTASKRIDFILFF
jgi:hypothetical protein